MWVGGGHLGSSYRLTRAYAWVSIDTRKVSYYSSHPIISHYYKILFCEALENQLGGERGYGPPQLTDAGPLDNRLG